MIKLISLLIPLALLSSCTLFPKKSNTTPTPTPINQASTPTIQATKPSSNTIVALNTKNGQMLIKLYSDVAPNTVKNFLSKISSGFYNDMTFHRVISGFMAQGGDPTGTGTGGGTQISELNNLPFKRGSLGLARTPNSKEVSNDSQFFICFTNDGCAHLTGEYVNFGEVISGFDVLDKISQGDRIIEITSNTK